MLTEILSPTFGNESTDNNRCTVQSGTRISGHSCTHHGLVLTQGNVSFVTRIVCWMSSKADDNPGCLRAGRLQRGFLDDAMGCPYMNPLEGLVL